MNIVYQTKILFRIRDTLAQVRLSREQRQKNVSGAFDAVSFHQADKAIFVIDDIKTSGSTLKACAEALFRACTNNVFGLMMARAE